MKTNQRKRKIVVKTQPMKGLYEKCPNYHYFFSNKKPLMLKVFLLNKWTKVWPLSHTFINICFFYDNFIDRKRFILNSFFLTTRDSFIVLGPKPFWTRQKKSFWVKYKLLSVSFLRLIINIYDSHQDRKGQTIF